MAGSIVVDVLEALRRLKLDAMDMDDMVALYSVADGLKSTYERYKVQVPDFVTEAMNLLDNDIKSKRKEYLLRQKKILEAKQQKLLSREEQKARADAQLAEIEQMLKE